MELTTERLWAVIKPQHERGPPNWSLFIKTANLHGGMSELCLFLWGHLCIQSVCFWREGHRSSELQAWALDQSLTRSGVGWGGLQVPWRAWGPMPKSLLLLWAHPSAQMSLAASGIDPRHKNTANTAKRPISSIGTPVLYMKLYRPFAVFAVFVCSFQEAV